MILIKVDSFQPAQNWNDSKRRYTGGVLLRVHVIRLFLALLLQWVVAVAAFNFLLCSCHIWWLISLLSRIFPHNAYVRSHFSHPVALASICVTQWWPEKEKKNLLFIYYFGHRIWCAFTLDFVSREDEEEERSYAHYMPTSAVDKQPLSFIHANYL